MTLATPELAESSRTVSPSSPSPERLDRFDGSRFDGLRIDPAYYGWLLTRDAVRAQLRQIPLVVESYDDRSWTWIFYRPYIPTDEMVTWLRARGVAVIIHDEWRSVARVLEKEFGLEHGSIITSKKTQEKPKEDDRGGMLNPNAFKGKRRK